MLRLQIPKNRMNYLIDGLQAHYDAAQVENGWDLFHKGKISGVELYGVEIHALVRESRAYDVIIDLEDFKKSECSCPDEGWCAHIPATVFALYVPYGRPELLLQHLKKELLVKAKQQQARTGGPRGDKKQDQVVAPAENKPPSSWHRYFDQQFYGFSVTHQSSIEAFYQTAQETLGKLAEQWPDPLLQLYRLHVVLFIMRKTEQFFLDSKSSYLSHYHESGCKAVAKLCLDQSLELLPELPIEQLLKQYNGYVKETAAMLSEHMLQSKDTPLDWLTVYRQFWWRAAEQKTWIQEELKHLRTEAEKSNVTPRKKDILLLAMAHFAVIRGDDQAAMLQLQELKVREPRDFFLYLYRFERMGEWERMLSLLRWLTPAMQRAGQDDFGVYCGYWTEAMQHQSSDEEWVAVMETLLPRTYYYYTAYLLQTSRFKHWVDLQISNRISPANLYAAELKAVEAHDPALLLPLYTQAVERCIVEKNRTSYATAVKLLKKLNGFYKQIGAPQRWDEYMAGLSAKYSRLRAFQEELKKGKWLP
ncbi:SWIM zinc finger family protein [Paenibacillus thalictri]|uniref:SWIM-type domain-containing protein n=1 Tax=Paenibacillus thalictri TaxID=2527873 RepID=A0A4Q9DHX3_9BACL|nr:hypothetical protein [Paenibacillus thalictri]TBL72666.1 hypothetical protein EYB31_28360 [Paenibacillus thalictri]